VYHPKEIDIRTIYSFIDTIIVMQKILVAARYLLIIPVVGCILMTAGVVVMGFGRIISAGDRLIEYGIFSPKASKIISLAVIEIIDLFLVGTVSYIAAIGLYKLFISKVDIQLPMRLTINNLNDLENKIIGVIVAALAVAFLGQAAGGETPEHLLKYGGGIAVVIAALTYFMSGNFGGKKKQAENKDK
jgi:uncharacterized membrane protein YqhA